MTQTGKAFVTAGARVALVILLAAPVMKAQVHAPYGFSVGGTDPATASPYVTSQDLTPSSDITSAPGFAPAQIENLVAPIALYPDSLLSEVLVASTYPLEIVEAQQWLERTGNLQGAALIDAAKRQSWDPSVQALVAFPDAVALLARDVQWTTALGNAFLAQQVDVMNAIQSLRARAQNNGRLPNTAQQIVTTQAQEGQTAIAIQPANPQVMYVPSYNPQYVWGAPNEGTYPQLGYPDSSNGFGFGDAVNLLSLFTGIGSGLSGILTGGWGWALSWFTHSVLLNGLFFNGLGFGGGSGYGGAGYSAGYGSGYGYGGYGGRSAWVHDPGHRLGVPYSSQALASRFHGTYRQASYSAGSGFSQGTGFSQGRGFAQGSGFSSGHAFASSSGFGSERGFATNPSSGGRSFVAGGGWHSASGPSGANTFGGSEAGRFGGGYGYGGFGNGANRGSGAISSGPLAGRQGPASGSQMNAGQNFGPRGFEPQRYTAQRYTAQNFSRPDASRQNFTRQSFSGQSFSGQSFSNQNSGSRNFSLQNRPAQNFSPQHFSQPQRFSQPRMSAPHFSAPKAPRMSAPHLSGGRSSSGHSGGGHSGGGSHGGSKRH